MAGLRHRMHQRLFVQRHQLAGVRLGQRSIDVEEFLLGTESRLGRNMGQGPGRQTRGSDAKTGG